MYVVLVATYARTCNIEELLKPWTRKTFISHAIHYHSNRSYRQENQDLKSAPFKNTSRNEKKHGH